MHVSTANTQGNPNIGLYAFATDSYCIIGPESLHLKSAIEEILGVKVVVTTIAGTSLAGIFLLGTEQHLVVPSIVFDHEIEQLKKTGAQVHVFDTKHTALGNNAVATKAGCLVGPMFSDEECDMLAQLLDVPVNRSEIANVEVTGSSVVATNKGCLVHRDASDFEIDVIQDTLGVPRLRTGTVNMGVPYVRSGIIANSKGFLIGSASGGPEITNADEALGFIEE